MDDGFARVHPLHHRLRLRALQMKIGTFAFLLLLSVGWFSLPLFPGSMTAGPAPLRSVTLKLSPKLSVSSSSTLKYYLHRTFLQMPVHPGQPQSHARPPRPCDQTSRSRLTPAPPPTPPGTASTGPPASPSRLASPSSTIASE